MREHIRTYTVVGGHMIIEDEGKWQNFRDRFQIQKHNKQGARSQWILLLVLH